MGKPRSENSGFGSGTGGTTGGTYICRICKKRTRETGHCESNADLCVGCYDYCGWENTHSDDDHASNPDDDCPICQGEPARGETG